MSQQNSLHQNLSQFTMSIVVERRNKLVNGWESIQWELSAILSDPDGPKSLEGPIVLRESDSSAQYMWKGLRLKLYVDASEGYWFNLMSEVPFAFVIFEQDIDENEPPIPLLISASQDEAGAHLETDSLVLSAPMPADIRDRTEEFVVNNYVPQAKKKRKRRNWVEESIRMAPQSPNQINQKN